MAARRQILSMVMAGGRGERLHPLTLERAKPAVPFGGKYRIIDFVLSNLVNSELTAIYVLIQFKSQSLLEHIQSAWPYHDPRGREFITAVPAQMRTGESWYRGTADAIYQNFNLIENHDPELVAVFGGDHVYRMDVRQMTAFHRKRKADVTVATIPVPLAQASAFGVMQVDEEGRVVGFEEKPERPAPMPGRPDMALASMGNYLFKPKTLKPILADDAKRQTDHDFGKTILPSIYKDQRVFAYDFATNDVPGRVKGEEVGYWRDIGSIRAYYDANMDLKNPDPIFNLYNHEWPVHTAHSDDPPAKFVFDETGRKGEAVNSLAGEGTILSGGRVQDSIIGRNVFVHSFSLVAESIVMDGVDIGRHCKIRRAIIDKDVKIPSGSEIGFDPERDRQRYFVDPESGLVVIPKAAPGEPS
jgi:glucose-1-phosphate adenylyltransferase